MFTSRTDFAERTNILLRTIYKAFSEGMKVVGPSYIALNLKCSKSTAQKMLISLSEKGFGEYIPKKGFILNEVGMEKAKEATRKHRLIECMLEDLGVENFCCEAEKIECFIGEEFMRVIESKYKNREICPCGKLIP